MTDLFLFDTSEIGYPTPPTPPKLRWWHGKTIKNFAEAYESFHRRYSEFRQTHPDPEVIESATIRLHNPL